MKIILAILSAWTTSSAAHNGIDLSVDIPAESKLGNNILSKARRVADAEEEEEEADYTWIANYSIKFKSSHSIDVFGGEGAEESSSPAGVEHLATFQLCPNDSKCSSCSKSGEYVMKLRDFVEAYAEMKKELSEAACEAVENDCNCDYYDDEDNCFATCYANAGLDDCGDDDEFEIEKYMECDEAEFNNGYYNVNYYIGPVIAKGGSAVYLDVFTDASCTVPAESGTYLKFMGSELPYSKENKVSIVNDDCITCQAVEENDGDDQQNNYYLQASESCAQIYEEAGKCERKLKGKTSSVDNETCNFIHNRLPALERVYKRGGGSSATTAFMWFFVVTTLGASAGAYYFYTIGQRSNIKLGNGGSRGNRTIL